MNQTETEFHEAMVDVYRRAKAECSYDATRYLQMVATNGGLESAHRLLSDTNLQSGFVELWQCGRLDVTVEYLVLKQEWRTLFSESELQIARQRLLDHGLSANRLPESP
jgi:hypothetical protein